MGEIRRYFRDRGSYIRIPRKLYEIFYKAERIKRHYDSDVSEERLARALQIPEETLRSAYEAGDIAFVHSLECEADADGSLVLSNLIGHDEGGFMMVEDSDFTTTVCPHCLSARRIFCTGVFIMKKVRAKSPPTGRYRRCMFRGWRKRF